MRILITGGAGFIGSHVADAYFNAGYEIAIIDNLSTGKREQVPKGVGFYKFDIRDKEALRRVFREFRPEVVNHHAAQIDIRKSVANPIFDSEVNIIGFLNLLESCIEFSAEKLIYISSGGAIYGEPEILPIPEDHKIQPLSPYGIAKYTGELYLNFYAQVRGLKYNILRYSNVYGPRQDPKGEAGVIAIFSELMLKGERPKIFGDGKQTRDYVFVEDVARANLCALKDFHNQAFNIGTSQATSVNDVFGLIKKYTSFQGKPEYLPARPGELRDNVLAIEKAKKLLGWQPQIQLEEGLRKTIDWVRKQEYSV